MHVFRTFNPSQSAAVNFRRGALAHPVAVGSIIRVGWLLLVVCAVSGAFVLCRAVGTPEALECLC